MIKLDEEKLVIGLNGEITDLGMELATVIEGVYKAVLEATHNEILAESMVLSSFLFATSDKKELREIISLLKDENKKSSHKDEIMESIINSAVKDMAESINNSVMNTLMESLRKEHGTDADED